MNISNFKVVFYCKVSPHSLTHPFGVLALALLMFKVQYLTMDISQRAVLRSVSIWARVINVHHVLDSVTVFVGGELYREIDARVAERGPVIHMDPQPKSLPQFACGLPFSHLNLVPLALTI